ncbi:MULTISPECIES: hypothetical protein [Streptomyces]|uniref:Uncharacterized protein n=1 Tax=Streptomyces ehimensis TaxID=68195 RepID=A0ABV9BQL5_9ACTN
MLAENLVALAEAAGTAVVAAAGTDAWSGLRNAVADWFGCGDAERERGELERLERSAVTLAAAGPDVANRVRVQQAAVWQTRIETLLEGLDDEEQRARAASGLRRLLAEAAPAPAGEAGQVSGNVFSGPTAFQTGNQSQMNARFGTRP